MGTTWWLPIEEVMITWVQLLSPARGGDHSSTLILCISRREWWNGDLLFLLERGNSCSISYWVAVRVGTRVADKTTTKKYIFRQADTCRNTRVVKKAEWPWRHNMGRRTPHSTRSQRIPFQHIQRQVECLTWDFFVRPLFFCDDCIGCRAAECFKLIIYTYL